MDKLKRNQERRVNRKNKAAGITSVPLGGKVAKVPKIETTRICGNCKQVGHMVRCLTVLLFFGTYSDSLLRSHRKHRASCVPDGQSSMHLVTPTETSLLQLFRLLSQPRLQPFLLSPYQAPVDPLLCPSRHHRSSLRLVEDLLRLRTHLRLCLCCQWRRRR